MYIRNEVILDGKVQKDVKAFDEIINFNLSSITGDYLTINNTKKNRYTFIRVVYTGRITDKVKEAIQEGNFVRIYGKIDSEQYKSQSGKIVYNKILVADKVVKLVLEPEIGVFTEVI